MSFQACTWAMAQKLDQPAAKLLLLILANNFDLGREEYTSTTTLSDDTGLSQRTVAKHLKSLKQSELLVSKPGLRGERLWRINYGTARHEDTA